MGFEEYEMYLHHLRQREGVEELGWCGTMIYSIGQQLMRQDPAYHLVYVALPPDHEWNLINYPYYTKYALAGIGLPLITSMSTLQRCSR